MPVEFPPDVVAFADAAGEGDEVTPLDLAHRALGGGNTFSRVLRDLIAEAQILVGHRWQIGEWTVAREHAATATAGNVVKRLAERVEPAADRTRTVIVTVAAGEWHSLGAEMVAHTLRSDGWRVVFLPPGTRPGQLATAIHDHGPAAVAITCSLGALLPGARRLIAAAQDAGTPAIVGGRAFGTDGTRARRLGANGWARDLVSASAAIATHAGFTEPATPMAGPAFDDFAVLHSELASMTDTIRNATRGLPEREADAHLGAALWIVRSLAASLLTEDPTIVVDDVAWYHQRVALGGPPIGPVLDSVVEALPDGVPLAAAMMERACAVPPGDNPVTQPDGGK